VVEAYTLQPYASESEALVRAFLRALDLACVPEGDQGPMLLRYVREQVNPVMRLVR
jgi:hypothetical protein